MIQPRRRTTFRTLTLASALVSLAALVAFGATEVPTDVQMPGTQPFEMPQPISSVANCNCHDFNVTAPNPAESVPVKGWTGAMMGQAGRDPLFWATVAVAEQDFDGVGDLCLKCHSLAGWLEGRSTPTNASGLLASDDEGIMCEFCHFLSNPDQENTIPNPPEGSYTEEQNGDFVAYDENTGEGYYGGAMYVLNSGMTRLGPYADHGARHDAIPSNYHRDARLCGTCHDVSNPAVGDLAPNHGSIAPFTGVFSGVPGAPVAGKAAFNNEPHTYGIVERTFSEWTASDLDTWLVRDFNSLPAELKTASGAPARAFTKALWGNCSDSGDFCKGDGHCDTGEACIIPPNQVDYEDGQDRYFTCQSCHMMAAGGEGANQGRPSPHKGEIRPDLANHDQTGGSYWIQDAMVHQVQDGTALFPHSSADEPYMDLAQIRAEETLRMSGSLSATQVGNQLEVTVTNLTGHKLISGYPEGRRMWLYLEWENSSDEVIHEDGKWGPLDNQGAPVTVTDLHSVPWTVQSIQDKSSTKVYEAKPGLTQDWAAALVSLGWPGTMPVEYDRLTNAVSVTLQDVADQSAGTDHESFHFVLNNAITKDNRIPPYGFDHDLALERNAVPIPEEQYGWPGTGAKYNHFDVVSFDIPEGADHVEVYLLYQSTSWEYIQFLWLRGLDNNDPFLGDEGVNMLDAWLNTGMSEPFAMTEIEVPVTAVSFNAPGHVSLTPDPLMQVTAYDPGTGAIDLSYSPACDADDHTVHYGPLADVETYGWADAKCEFDVSGTAAFTPEPAVGESIFWVMVGNNASYEGSYSTDSGTAERPANTAAAGSCFRPQNLATVCE